MILYHKLLRLPKKYLFFVVLRFSWPSFHACCVLNIRIVQLYAWRLHGIIILCWVVTQVNIFCFPGSAQVIILMKFLTLFCAFWFLISIRLFCLGATPPPRSLRSWSMRIPLACCLLFLLALLMLTYLHFFVLFLPFFDFDLDSVCFLSCLFLAGTMLSPRFRFLLRLV